MKNLSIFIYFLILSIAFPIKGVAKEDGPQKDNGGPWTTQLNQATRLMDEANFTPASELLEKVIFESTQQGHKAAEAKARSMLGQIYVMVGNPDVGFNHLNKALLLSASLSPEKNNITEIKVMAYNGLGIYYLIERGDYYLAKEYVSKSVLEASKAKDMKMMRKLETNLLDIAVMANDVTELPHAVDLYQWSKESGELATLFNSASNLAQLYVFDNQLDKAEELLKEAKQISSKYMVGNRQPLYMAESSLYEKRGEFRNALNVLDEAERLLEDGNEAKCYRSIIYSKRTGVYLSSGQYRNAVDMAQSGLRYSLKESQLTHIDRLYRQLSEAYQGIGNNDSALFYARKYAAYRDSVFDIRHAQVAQAINAEYHLHEKEIETERAKEISTAYQRSNRILWIGISIIMIIATIAVIAYIQKTRLYKKVVKLNVIGAKSESELEKRIADIEVKDPISDEKFGEAVEVDDVAEDADESKASSSTSATSALWIDFYNELMSASDWSDEFIGRDAMCKRLHTNRTYLSKAVKDATGKTYQQYINHIRIRRAIEILSSEDGKEYPLKQLASDLGFGSLKSFYTNFKSETGLSPASFRSNLR